MRRRVQALLLTGAYIAMREVKTMGGIHPQTYIGPVHYTTRNLARQVEFYRDVLGFHVLRHVGDTAVLGAMPIQSEVNGSPGHQGAIGRELLRLTEMPDAPVPNRTTGLYHTAFLVPTRWDLAHLVQRVIDTRTPVQGHSNHGTHLALYLPDPEGNGIELAWDFPKEDWPMRDGKMLPEEMPREGIDLADLLAELERDPSPWPGLPRDTVVGHIHLHVSELEPTRRFYHDLLGFDITVEGYGMGALFFSAGGYHHHIGTNVWRGVGTPPPPEGAMGLRYFTIVLPDEVELARIKDAADAAGLEVTTDEDGVLLRDPSQNGVRLTVGTSS